MTGSKYMYMTTTITYIYDNYYDITYIWTQKIIQMDLYTKQKQTHRQNKLTGLPWWRSG